MIVLFGAWEWRQQEDAIIPTRIIGNKSMIFSAVVSLVGLGGMSIVKNYVPIWFQVVKHESPVHSGIRLLLNVLSSLSMSIISGALGKAL
jgi:hypothetical protein